MAKLLTLQPFDSVHALTKHYGIQLPCAMKSEWRLLQRPIVGHVNGVFSLQGTLLATNGILATMERENRIEIVHIDFFVADEQSETVKVLIKKETAPKSQAASRKNAVDISEYI